jgi:hypothetical protein
MFENPVDFGTASSFNKPQGSSRNKEKLQDLYALTVGWQTASNEPKVHVAEQVQWTRRRHRQQESADKAIFYRLQICLKGDRIWL